MNINKRDGDIYGQVSYNSILTADTSGWFNLFSDQRLQKQNKRIK